MILCACSRVLDLWALIFLASSASRTFGTQISPEKCLVWGPGLKSEIVLPVRYFFIQAVGSDGDNFTSSAGAEVFDVSIYHPKENRVRVWQQVLDKQDGTYVVRFRMYAAYDDLKVNILYKDTHVAGSPYIITGRSYQEKCYCPKTSIASWLKMMECPKSYKQIRQDLSIFKDVDLEKVAEEAVARFNQRGMHSLCRYRIIDNKIYRKTYGEHVGFKMFSDAIILSTTRKVHLPDIEFFVNLGDWPLEKRRTTEEPLPIFSWCGSDDSRDIVMPTYDITEATLEMMGRVSLDVFSTMSRSQPPWSNKTEKGFWRGRDSRQERLDLVVMSRKSPDLIDAALTHMFFFKKEPEKYGELVKSVPFFDFFKYKYQINLDGTVAAYRFPYLLAGNSVVLKQESNYYEHFYKALKPFEHYIPFKRDLSDLVEKLQWAKDNDEKVEQIARNARQFVFENLLPKDIYCYHVKVFHEFSKKIRAKPQPPDESWELVSQPEDNDSKCDCKRKKPKKKKDKHDEL